MIHECRVYNSQLQQEVCLRKMKLHGVHIKKLNANMWKDFLCSKAVNNAQQQHPSQAIADLAKQLCAEEVDPPYLTEYLDCRLITLNKGITKGGKADVGPIGVGKGLSRIVGKLLIGVIKDNIISAA